MDVCRHCCSEGSYRELGASFPGPHLQPPESEANKGVHPEEGGRAPKDRLHPFPPQPALPRGLLALQPLDLLGAEEARTAVRRDPQTACGYTCMLQTDYGCTWHAAGLQRLCGAGHSSLSLTQTGCRRLPGSASKPSGSGSCGIVASGWDQYFAQVSTHLYLGSTYPRPAKVGGPSRF